MKQIALWLGLLILLAVCYVAIAGWPFPPSPPANGVNVDVEKGKSKVDINAPGVLSRSIHNRQLASSP